jgi:lysophospholipase L1-like esterase
MMRGTLGSCLVLIAAIGFGSVHVRAAEPAKIDIALAGDSTVTDQAGWGKAFAELLGPQAACTNFAAGGRSSKSFRSEGRWQKVLEAKPDYVFIQFGHNDQPGKGPARETDPATTFREFLRQYVDEARAAGAKPILVTSLCRRIFIADGKINRQQQPYADAVKAVAAEKQVPLVDLYALSIEVAERLGPEKSKSFGPPHPERAGMFDGTHLSADGAKQIAPLIAKAAVAAVPELKAYLPSVEK